MTRALGKIPLGALAIALASLILPARASQTLDPPSPPASSKALFAPGRLHTIHIHLSAEHCLEVIVLRGPRGEVLHMAHHLMSARGVLHGKFVPTTSGEEMA